MPNCYAKVSQEPVKLQTPDRNHFHDHNESTSTVTPIEETPLTSRKESKDDLRKYVKMVIFDFTRPLYFSYLPNPRLLYLNIPQIAELQQSRDEFLKIRDSIPSPPLSCREVPRKHYTKKEVSLKDEDSSIWQPASEVSYYTVEIENRDRLERCSCIFQTTQDTSEFIPISQKVSTKCEQQRTKPPWKWPVVYNSVNVVYGLDEVDRAQAMSAQCI